MLPQPKVAAAGIAGLVTLVIVTFAGAFGVDLPPEVVSAGTTLACFLAGYFKSNR